MANVSLEDAHSKEVRLQSAFLKWAGLNLRSFPWRSLSTGAYGVLIAEILLKRTTAVAATRLYATFLKKYPSIEHLSTVSEEQLATDLLPVGLHTQRAKTLKRLAVHLVEATNGAVPDSLEALLKVPSLGQYSARAILSFGFGQPYAVVDSNVQRILRRVYGSQFDDKAPLKVYQRLADELLPKKRHRQFNLGMLDLGALVCRPVNPKCDECPLSQVCDYASGNSGVSEVSPTKTGTRVRHLRKSAGMSLVHLASLSGVSKATLTNIEKGRTAPKPQTLSKILEAL